MSGAKALQDSNSKVIETIPQPASGMGTSEKKECLRILHVDDDIGLLEISKQILLTENNFEIENVISVDEAFEKLERQTYDAIVSDHEMPLKSGLEFLKKLREQKRDIPFILFTGKGREDVAVKALNLGADSYINKNGSPETVYCELANAINKTVERKKSKQLLVESEIKYRTLVERSLQGILITQTSPLQLIFANESMGNILGYSTDELKALSPKGVAGLIHDEDKAVFFSRLESRMHGEPADSSLEFRAVRKNGSIVWLEAFANRIEYMGKQAVQGMFLDITERKKVHGILRESEERYRELANCLPEIVFETDLNGQLVFANERATEISRYSQGELEKGMNVLQFLAPEDRERAKKSIQRLLAGDSYAPDEYIFLRKDGTTFPALITITLRISKNKATGLRGLVIDITERKKTEESLEKEQQELNRIIDSSPIIIFYKDKEGKFVRVNEAFAEAQKIPKEKFIGKTVFDFFSADIAREMANDDSEVLKSGCPKLGIIEKYESANGMRWVQTDKVPILDKNGVPNGIIGFAQDITDRKKAEEETQSLAKFPSENPNPVIRINKDGTILFSNKAAQILINEQKRGEKQRFIELIQQSVIGCLRSGLPKENEVKFEDKTYSFVLAPVAEGDYVNVYGRDVTERNRMAEALQESEGRLRSIVENSSDQIFMLDRDCRFLLINKIAADLFGIVPKEVVGRSISEVFPEIIAAQFSKNIKNVVDTGRSMVIDEKMVVKGRKLYGSTSLNPVRNDSGRVVAVTGIVRDITEHKIAEEVLRESEESFRSLIDSMDDLVFVLNLDGTFKNYHQPSREKDLYAAPEEFIGKHFMDVLPPQVAELCQAAMKRIEGSEETQEFDYPMEMNSEKSWYNARLSPTKDRSGQKTSVTIVVRNITERKKAEEVLLEAEQEKRDILDSMREFVGYFDMNQKIVWANRALCNWLSLPAGKVIGRTCLEISSQSKPCDHCPVVKTLKTGQPENAEVTLPNGKLLWMDAYPIRDKMGQMQGAVEISTDITELRKTGNEISSLNEKLDALGKITRHDIKNKLQVINSHIFLAERHGKNENTPEWKALQAVKQASLQIGKILDFAKDYEMLGSEELSCINVSEVFSEAVALSPASKDVKIVNDCRGLSVLADSLLRELFYNLVDNSLKYGEKITQIRFSFEKKSEQLLLTYEDDGVGIPLSEKQKLFTKGFGKGTGLGLYLIKKIMEVYGWSIKEEGVEGKGVKFTISIPEKNRNGDINYQI